MFYKSFVLPPALGTDEATETGSNTGPACPLWGRVQMRLVVRRHTEYGTSLFLPLLTRELRK